MDNELYEAAREGNIDFLNEAQTLKFEKGDEITQESYFVLRTADSGDNILHIAGSHGHVAFINKALEKLPALVLLICPKNSYRNNPWQLEAVKVLVESYKSYLQNIGAKSRSMLSTLMIAEEGVAADPWSTEKSSGETPLPEALKNEYQDAALYLFEADPDLANFINDRDECVLYVAAAHGQEKALEKVINSEKSYSIKGPGGATPLHAAIYACTVRAVELLLEKRPELIKKTDNHKMTALHCAAERGPEWSIKLLLKRDRSCAYLRDAEGLTPLLKGATSGRMQAVQIILLHCPQSITICDTKGGSILHIITLKSKQDGDELVKLREVNRLNNEPDHEGNTPLHQAVLDCNLIMVDLLLGNYNTDLMARNKEGLMAWESINSLPEVSDSMAEIGYKLLMHERGSQTHTYLEQDNQLRRRQVDPQERWHHSFSNISIIAVVLAAISFVGMLLLLGKTDNQGNAILANKSGKYLIWNND
ncbi:ACCELERATED CELL DEATH 6-like protein [Drosera capensis]